MSCKYNNCKICGYKTGCEIYKENTELKKSCDETQELLDKQIEATYKLVEENAELKKEVEDSNEKVVHLACNQNKDLKYKLTKAKEIIKDLVRVEYADFTNGDYSNELSKVLEQAEQFISEV